MHVILSLLDLKLYPLTNFIRMYYSFELSLM